MAAKTPKAPRQPQAPVQEQVVIRPIVHLTIRQWQDNPDLQRKLRALIEDPVFLLAHNTLTNAAFPGCEPSTKADPGVTAEAMNGAMALRYAHRSGMGYYPRMMKVLAADKATKMPENPYGQLLAEDE